MPQRSVVKALKKRQERLATLEAALVGLRQNTPRDQLEAPGQEPPAEFIETLINHNVPEGVVLECMTLLALHELRNLLTFSSETVCLETDPAVAEALRAFRKVLDLLTHNQLICSYLTSQGHSRVQSLARLLCFRLRQDLALQQSLYLATIRHTEEAFRAFGITLADVWTCSEDDKSAELDACLEVWDDPRHLSDSARVDAWMAVGGPLAHALASCWASGETATGSLSNRRTAPGNLP
jgi:hypothetical protein